MKLFVFFLIFSSSAWGLTEQDVIKSVLTHFPLIDEANLKADSAEGEETAAKGEFDHKLKFKTQIWRQRPYNNEYYETFLERQTPWGGAKLVAGHRQGAGAFNYYDLKKDTSNAGQIFAGITLPLLRDFQTDAYRTNLLISQLRRERAEQEVRLKKLIYVHKGLSAYYKWVLGLKKLEVYRQLAKLAQERQQMLDKKFRAGDSDQLKVTDNARQINKRQGEVLKAEIELRKLEADLALFVRDSEGNPIQVSSVENAEGILLNRKTPGLASGMKTNPQVTILNFEQQLNQAEYDLSNQAKLPGLNVDVTGAQELSNRPGYGEHILQVGVNFDFPLENRKARGKSVAYHYKKKAVEKELLYAQQEIEQQYRFSISASETSLRRWQTSKIEYENSKKVAEGERKKWALGASDLFVVNMREQDLADVDLRQWMSLYDYHQYNLDASLFSASLPIE